jgi:hypothetical protein
LTLQALLSNTCQGLQYLDAPFAERIFVGSGVVNVVPEPTTLVLSLSGLIGLVAARKRARA